MKRLLLLLAIFIISSNAFATNTVSGKVTKSTTGNPAYPAEVYLIHKTFSSATNSYMLTLLDSTVTDTLGEYHFYNVTASAGDLLVKAALTSANPDYLHYLPTYKENSLTWNNAHAVSFTLGANNIHLAHGTNPGGPAFIGGSVLQGANKTTAVGDPLPARLITLTTTNDDPVASTYSDASGNFSFSNLAYGSYKLFGDVWDKQNPELIVTVDATTPTMNSIVFQESSQSFTGQLFGLNVTNTVLTDVRLYPNPVTDNLVISGLDKKGLSNIAVVNVNGIVVYKQATNVALLKIPFNTLASGLYIVHITTTEGQASYTVIK